MTDQNPFAAKLDQSIPYGRFADPVFFNQLLFIDDLILFINSFDNIFENSTIYLLLH